MKDTLSIIETAVAKTNEALNREGLIAEARAFAIFAQSLEYEIKKADQEDQASHRAGMDAAFGEHGQG